MSVFRFRQFSVENKESAMKVNTDGVLLGALMTIRGEDRTYLDVGTGTGTIALMAAQRVSEVSGEASGRGGASDDVLSDSASGKRPESAPVIIGIDIDGPSAREAARNFGNSPWNTELKSLHCSLDEFSSSAASGNEDFRIKHSAENALLSCPHPGYETPAGFDRIFSNPPYFDMSLQAPDGRRNTARHTAFLSYRELIAFAAGHLNDNGILSLILPADTETWLLRHARMSGLHPFRIVRVRTTPKKKPSRIVAEFSRLHRTADIPEGTSAGFPVMEESLLTIRDGGEYTVQYLTLVRDFLLI